MIRESQYEIYRLSVLTCNYSDLKVHFKLDLDRKPVLGLKVMDILLKNDISTYGKHLFKIGVDLSA
jgi:hypothetical protein